jgi:hypothetical protein
MTQWKGTAHVDSVNVHVYVYVVVDVYVLPYLIRYVNTYNCRYTTVCPCNIHYVILPRQINRLEHSNL